jgi:hypothetical protein
LPRPQIKIFAGEKVGLRVEEWNKKETGKTAAALALARKRLGYACAGLIGRSLD